MMNEDFNELLQTAEGEKISDTSEFLEVYQKMGQPLSREHIETVLTPHSLGDYNILSELLLREAYQTAILNMILFKSDWWSIFGRERICDLQIQSVRTPELAQSLSALAQRALPEVVRRAQAGARGRQVREHEKATLEVLVDFIYCATPPDRDAEVWLTLLNQLDSLDNLDWRTYGRLVKVWSEVIPAPQEYGKDLRFLFSFSWERFGSFLELRLPPLWNEMATYALIAQLPSPNREIIRQFENSYHSNFEELFQQLSQNPLRDRRGWHTARTLLRYLVGNGYGQKTRLLFILLDSDMGKDSQIVRSLLEVARLSVEEQEQFLREYGHKYIVEYHKNHADIVLQMLGELVQNNIKYEKMQILFNWLDASPLKQKNLEYEQQMILSLSRLFNTSVIPAHRETRQRLREDLSHACIEVLQAEGESCVAKIIRTLQNTLPAQDFLPLLSTMTESTLEGIKQKRYAQSLLIPYIQLALHMELVLKNTGNQDFQVDSLLDKLLQGEDEKTIKQLDREAKKWSPEISAEWETYKLRYPDLLGHQKISLLERIKFW